jgi:hypothetical protein
VVQYSGDVGVAVSNVRDVVVAIEVGPSSLVIEPHA